MKLLIVDDQPISRKVLRISLEHGGHSVSEAINGIEALKLLEHETVDAVVSDVLMPSMDGFRLCREMRKHERLHSIPLILYTATYDSQKDRELAESVGADAYILKPAPPGVILDAVRVAHQRERRITLGDQSEDDSTDVLERYSSVLVRKLEARNAELQEALWTLQKSHESAAARNRSLDACVTQRDSALRSANQQLQTFSSLVLHELRAPLRHILGYVQSVQLRTEASLSLESHKSLDYIESTARQMDSLVTSLLNFARSSQAELSLQIVDLDLLLDEALEALTAETRGRAIEWHRPRLASVRADKGLLHQVFVDLLSNALKFSRPRQPAVIEIGERPGRPGEVVLFVRDNGVGFEGSRAKELFNAFTRLHHRHEFEGVGVGLANVQRIIARHSGHIWAESALDQGATFYFSLPRA